MRILDIIAGTSVDGPGLRTSVYFAGCGHGCPGCHNPQSWPRDGGVEMTLDQVMDVVRSNDFNVTFSGGDPLYQAAEASLLAQAVKEEGYSLWCYTGFTYGQALAIPGCAALLRYVDVLVDGPYVEGLRDISLRFRGSSNQRLIDVPASLADGSVRLFEVT